MRKGYFFIENFQLSSYLKIQLKKDLCLEKYVEVLIMRIFLNRFYMQICYAVSQIFMKLTTNGVTIIFVH